MVMHFLSFISLIFLILNNAYAQDFSEGTSKDLARQCFKTHKLNASNYNRTLNSSYDYYPASPSQSDEH